MREYCSKILMSNLNKLKFQIRSLTESNVCANIFPRCSHRYTLSVHSNLNPLKKGFKMSYQKVPRISTIITEPISLL